MKVRAHGLRHIGKVRETNEDQILVDEPLGLFVVADGMGGHAAGEIASEIAVSSIAEFTRGSLAERKSADPPDAQRVLEQAVAEANRRICASIVEHPHRRGMGTTVVAALLSPDLLVIGQVGDSRC